MTACPMNAPIENVLQEHISHLAVHSLLPPNDLMNLILDLICTAQTCIWSHWLELYRDRLPYDRADRKCAPGAHFTSRCAFTPTTGRSDVRILQPFRITFGHQQKGEP